MAIRITGGSLRGRQVASPAGSGTRPTGSMAREALFNILSDVSGFEVLDLFAGSGIIGIEALSRGAKAVTAVELNKAQASKIREAYRTLGLAEKLTLLERDALTLQEILKKGSFDLIYADPPFTREYPDLRIFLQFLAPGGVAVFECPSRKLPSWTAEGRVRRYGESSLAFFGG